MRTYLGTETFSNDGSQRYPHCRERLANQMCSAQRKTTPAAADATQAGIASFADGRVRSRSLASTRLSSIRLEAMSARHLLTVGPPGPPCREESRCWTRPRRPRPLVIPVIGVHRKPHGGNVCAFAVTPILTQTMRDGHGTKLAPSMPVCT